MLKLYYTDTAFLYLDESAIGDSSLLQPFFSGLITSTVYLSNHFDTEVIERAKPYLPGMVKDADLQNPTELAVTIVYLHKDISDLIECEKALYEQRMRLGGFEQYLPLSGIFAQ